MSNEEKKTAKAAGQTTPWGKALAGTLYLLTLFFVLDFLWQSLGEFL